MYFAGAVFVFCALCLLDAVGQRRIRWQNNALLALVAGLIIMLRDIWR